MHRLQRLHALVDHLRAARSAVTVAELAETFGVTERTMFRDLAALRANEIPIESDPGPGGGIRLSRSYLLPPLGLSLEEAVALWITVQLHGARHHRALTQALDKVIAGIPAERRVTFERVLRRIVIGPEATAEQQQDAVPPDPEIYRTVEQAVLQGLCLQLDYRDRDGRRTQPWTSRRRPLARFGSIASSRSRWGRPFSPWTLASCSPSRDIDVAIRRAASQTIALPSPSPTWHHPCWLSARLSRRSR
jgi:predicted DNA-binding transcriptional regulator YafY